MRKAALVGVCLMMSGCAGFDKFVSDTVTLPGENPNAPAGSDLNMRRVQGQATKEVPILPQGGNVWPGPPDPLPTLEDVARGRAGRPQGATLPATGPQLPDGQEISIGEQENIHKGIVGRGPDGTPDVGAGRSEPPAAGGKVKAAPIEIPNGDGTTTLIQPDGSISTIGTPPQSRMPSH